MTKKALDPPITLRPGIKLENADTLGKARKCSEMLGKTWKYPETKVTKIRKHSEMLGNTQKHCTARAIEKLVNWWAPKKQVWSVGTKARK